MSSPAGFDVAQADARQAAALLQQQEREESHLRSAEAQYEEARVCLERLCQEANCTEIDQLAEAEQRSQAGARLEKDLAAAQEELMIATAGDDPARFIAEVERADSDALDASIKELETRIASLENEQRAVQETIGAAREALSRMNGSADAAETAENIQTLMARLQGDVSRFATLKLAAAVLHRGIERYREQNQGPILARASELFAVLTGGSFTRLQIDDDGNGHSVIKGVRPGGLMVGVEGMSDGTHDQLYLALRLASLESWLQSHEPVPFIVDDILLNFDDDRATAALLRPGGTLAKDTGPFLHSPSSPGRPGMQQASCGSRLHSRAGPVFCERGVIKMRRSALLVLGMSLTGLSVAVGVRTDETTLLKDWQAKWSRSRDRQPLNKGLLGQ